MTEAIATGLSKNDIKALKQADRVALFHLRTTDFRKGEGLVRCIKDISNPGPFGPREKEHEVPVVSFISSVAEPATVKAFELIHVSQYNQEWQTIVGLLRAGDEIELHWSADNFANGYVEAADVVRDCGAGGHVGKQLHADALHLKVCRNGKQKYSFLLEVSICPNNTARMIQGA